jgi:methyltransferase (TIGR00027 family)
VATSRTAQFVALYRALEHRERRRPRLFADPFAHAFLPTNYRLLVQATWLPPVHDRVRRYADFRAPGARTSAIARTRFIDDLARGSLADGVRQMVVLGAGFDTRAHRLRELADVPFFEVDAIGTQTAKRAVLRRLRGRDHVRYVPVDFLRDDLASALVGAGWDTSRRTLVVWEGVTNYLTHQAVETVLGWVAGIAGGAVLVFTYVHAGLLDGSVAFEGGAQILGNVRTLGEPWTFGLRPDEVRGFLARSGLTLREELGADDYRARYLPADPPDRGYSFYRLAVATTRALGA